MIDPYIPPGSPVEESPASLRTDFESLMAAPPEPSALPSPRLPARTDFASLRASSAPVPVKERASSFPDYVIDALTPVLIFVLVNAVMMYLLNVRYIYTAVHDANLRVFVFFFVLGVVALNRVTARNGSKESVLYVFGMTLAVGLYTLATTELYSVGSVSRNFLNDNLWVATALNMALVIFFWWLVNRLTHECCVDENAVAGDIGMFTATVEKMRAAVQRASQQPEHISRPSIKGIDQPWIGIQAVDPLERVMVERLAEKKRDHSARLPKQHPGMALFYFSVPVMILFSVGLRVIQHAGASAVRMGAFYMYVYTFCVLALLTLCCLRQLRAYFNLRDVIMPGAMVVFWLFVSMTMILVIMWGASVLPAPSLPPVAYVDYHQIDVYNPGRSAPELLNIKPPTMVMLEKTHFVKGVDWAARIVVALLLLYALLKLVEHVVALMMLRQNRLPGILAALVGAVAWLLFRLFPALFKMRLPTGRLRIQRHVALSARYENPMGRPETANMPVREQVVYAYEALRALAMDIGSPARSSHTPYEFLECFPERMSGIREEAEEIVRLYVIAAYSTFDMDARIEDRLRKFWMAFRATRSRFVR